MSNVDNTLRSTKGTFGLLMQLLFNPIKLYLVSGTQPSNSTGFVYLVKWIDPILGLTHSKTG
jgi:hypothetical protein